MRFYPDSFSLKTAWRDARSRYKSLLLYSSGIIAGVAALVAILSFRSDVMLTVNDQARELLGADLEIEQTEPFSEEMIAFMDSLGGVQSRSIEFNSMVIYGSEGMTRLSQIRGIEGGFPFYGQIKTDPPEAAQNYQQDGTALVDRPVMTQLNLSVGDSIRVGDTWLEISGTILEFPGESAAFSLIGPRVVVSRDILDGSRLLDRGSRVQFKQFFQFDDERDYEAIITAARELVPDRRLTTNTVESRKQDFSQILDNLTRFLGMIGFIALMLGGLGVASAVYLYVRQKRAAVATLRCLGVSSSQILWIFGLQIVMLGFVGSLIGALTGVLIQRVLPLLFTDLLPLDIIQQVSLPAIITGLLTGLIVSFTLALLPLLSIVKISPLLTIRNSEESPLAQVSLGAKSVIIFAGLLVLFGILAFLLDNLLASFLFILGLLVSLAFLWAMARLLIFSVRKLRLPVWPYTWRQGIANLFRPQNQTTILLTTIGMGMLLIGTLYLSRGMILQRIDFQTGDQQPNLVFYDVQADQNEDVNRMAREAGVNVLDNVPIVTMRLHAVNDRTVREIRQDTAYTESPWALTREYRVTYRDELTESETILEGEWTGSVESLSDPVPVSLDYRLAEELKTSVGDRITFDVQGVRINTVVGSIRDVDFQQPRPNFFLVFPAGVLENAPRFYATTLRAPDEDTAALLQQDVVRAHPNVSAIDVGLVLESVRQFLDKVAIAVRFMAWFSIITGLMILASSLSISRYQRIRESVLLRTIGASKKQISGIQFVEYLWLGTLACLTGLLLALTAAMLLSRFFFELPFEPETGTLLLTSLGVILLILLTGALNMRDVNRRKPLEILRESG